MSGKIFCRTPIKAFSSKNNFKRHPPLAIYRAKKLSQQTQKNITASTELENNNNNITNDMRKIILLITVCSIAIAANAQDVPYSKYLNFNKKEFKDNHFKYDSETNTWALRKTDGLYTTLNVLAILATGEEDIRPSTKDYAIAVQMGEEGQASFVKVKFYNDETYHKILTFLKENTTNLTETSSGKIIKHHASHGDYSLELNMEVHNVTRTTSHTASSLIDNKARKTIDKSYNKYEFYIRTDIDPWSEYLEKKAAKQAKRDAKGKKKQNVDDLM